MLFPSYHDIMKALDTMPRHPLISGLAQLDCLGLSAETLFVDVVAFDICTAAHAIPNPRLTHNGPWTPGWTPL